jgi:hypothetical protein
MQDKRNWRERLGARGAVRLSLIGCVAVIALIGTYFFGKAASVAETRGELSSGTSSDERDGLFAANSPWEVHSSTDSMTDVAVTQAVATIEGNQFNVEVSVSCNSVGDIAYSATSFDKSGKPAEMRTEVTTSATRYWGVNGNRREVSSGVSIPFQVRADGQPALSWSDANPQYSNQIRFQAGEVYPSSEDTVEQLAAASNVALRLFMATGEETVELPQGDATFRKVIEPCLEQRMAKRAELIAAHEQKEAAERRQAQAYIDGLYDDSSVDADTLVWLASNRSVAVDQARLDQKRKREANLTVRPENKNNVSAM